MLDERKIALEGLKKSDSTNANKYQTEINEINKLLGEVTGLTDEKKKFEKEIEDWLKKYSHGGSEPLFGSSFNASNVAETISGGNGTDGAANRLGSGGSDSYGLDEVKSNIQIGMLEAVFPEVLRQFHARVIKKQDVEKFMNDNPNTAFWDNKISNPKSSSEIKKIDTSHGTKYDKKVPKDIVNNIKPLKKLDIKDFLNEENYPDPLDKVNLDGKSDKDLKTTFAGKEEASVNSELAKTTDSAKKYQAYTALQSTGNGNCFLNSFSILLNGDEALATRLRAKLCLELMSVQEITEKLTNRTIEGQACSLTKTDSYKEVVKTGGFAIVEYPVKGANPFGKLSITEIKIKMVNIDPRRAKISDKINQVSTTEGKGVIVRKPNKGGEGYLFLLGTLSDIEYDSLEENGTPYKKATVTYITRTGEEDFNEDLLEENDPKDFVVFSNNDKWEPELQLNRTQLDYLDQIYKTMIVDLKRSLPHLHYSVFRRLNGIKHNTAKKEERQNNPEIELNEDQFENPENIRLQERISFLTEFYEKFGGESYILELDGKIVFQTGDKFKEEENQKQQNQEKEKVRATDQKEEKPKSEKSEEQNFRKEKILYRDRI
ncbi:2735_t:CDS:2 [Entrophospora sp. SA101]|nr:10182_t:CDS:2 [Entrophospora sp. SA101]CAJ0890542.1 2735_t:CDS:2 [Entrophospora sp. SA101]